MRIDRLFFFLLTFVVVSCNGKQMPTEQESELIAQIEQILSVRQQLASKYWPEFNDEKYAVPIVIYADTACYVVNPKAGFLKEFSCKEIAADKFQLYKTERLDTIPFHMETHVALFDTTTYSGKTPYVMCSSLSETQKMYSDVTDNTVWFPMVVHELVHGCQDAHPNHYIARQSIEYQIYEIDLAAYPSQYPWLSDALVKENDCLLSAISADDESEMNGFIKEFLSCRKERKEKMMSELGEVVVKQEEEFETAESLARFMEVQSAILLNSSNPNYAEDSFFFCEDVREEYFFITGYNLVRLFIKMGIDLDLPYHSTEHRAFETYIDLTLTPTS